MKTYKILSALFLLAVFGKVYAQDTRTDFHTLGITIPTVAIVDIEPALGKNITMAFTAPIEAGLPVVAPASNATLWLNYSYIPTASAKTAKVSVKMDAVVPGLDVRVQAATATGTNGGGTLGTIAGSAITLTAADQQIISAIGASYTGDGAANGHNLTYSLNATNYAGLFASTPSVIVTYTISEN
ncbi:hypothetical protein [Flavobacterium aquidurense]|jgi:hypothetical protein|uniref:hypothetical protein n=1 Tax=Flavobacterium aquidurense TaxID=362413 RepID=UPI00371E5786